MPSRHTDMIRTRWEPPEDKLPALAGANEQYTIFARAADGDLGMIRRHGTREDALADAQALNAAGYTVKVVYCRRTDGPLGPQLRFEKLAT